jgi:immunity protein 51 of polymorphic toxin system
MAPVGHTDPVPGPLDIRESDKFGPSISFACGELPVDDAVRATGHEPNGYFWESVARYGAPAAVAGLDVDCEAGMFAAYGDRDLLEQLGTALRPYLTDRARVTELITRAEAEGFEFDD